VKKRESAYNKYLQKALEKGEITQEDHDLYQDPYKKRNRKTDIAGKGMYSSLKKNNQ
jgi:hypothetical protein